ncbi:MAG: POTRA domain-containing protein [bacterium]
MNFPFRVDSIKITGNDTTEDYIILRELTFAIGDTINQKSVDFNKERIFSLRIFNDVNFIPQANDSLNILEINVSESWYIYPVPFFYYKNNDFNKSIYGLDFKYKNFRGRNETLILNFSFGFDPSISLNYISPAFDYENEISLSSSFTIRKSSNKSSRALKLYGEDFNYNTYSGQIQIGKRLNPFNSIYSYFHFQYIQGPENPELGITASGEQIDRIYSLGFIYVYDTRDLAQFPKEGTYASVLYTHKGFGINNINYNLSYVDFRKYRLILDTFTSKFRLYGRHSFGKLIPFYDYSYLGYDEFVRGHSDESREGNNSFIASVEIAYPIIKDWEISLDLPLLPKRLTTARIDIHINIFGDTGFTFENDEKVALNNFNSGYGWGLSILFLPHNALRFEYALNEFGKGEFLFGTGFSF